MTEDQKRETELLNENMARSRIQLMLHLARLELRLEKLEAAAAKRPTLTAKKDRHG